MRKIVLVAAIAAGALSLAACSEQTEDAAGEAADSAMADTEANMEAAGDMVGGAADEAGDAISGTANEAEAELHDESEAEAAAD
jgi:predicted small secreted protein